MKWVTILYLIDSLLSTPIWSNSPIEINDLPLNVFASYYEHSKNYATQLQFLVVGTIIVLLQ